MGQSYAGRPSSAWKRSLVMFAAFALVVAACGDDDAETEASGDDDTTGNADDGANGDDGDDGELQLDRPLVIASIEPMTGSNVLTQYINGVKMAVDDINEAGGIGGHPVELKEYDNQLDAQAAVSAAQLAVSEGADIVIGMPATITNNAAAPIIQRAGIVYLNAGVSTPIALDEELGSDMTFRIMTPMPELIYALSQFIIEDLTPEKVGLMGLNIDYGQNALPLFEEFLGEAGIETTEQRLYPFDATDLTSEILSMEGSDAIIDWSYPNQTALGLRTAIQNGLDGIPYIGGPSASIVNSRELVPADAQENLYGVQSCDPRTDSRDYVQEWAQRYEETFDEQPDYSSPSVYDAVYFVKKAVETAGSLDHEAIADAMREITLDEDTMCATSYSIDDRNQLSHEAVVMSFAGGEPVQERRFTADELEGTGVVQG